MGLMGIVSNAVLDAGGETIGVIPRAMITKGGEGQNIIQAAARVVADNLYVYEADFSILDRDSESTSKFDEEYDQ